MDTYMKDSHGKVGRVVETDPPGTVWLRAPGGGTEWPVSPDELAPLTPQELTQAHVLDTPAGRS
ncbi:hypothetical protein [Streptomyces sp. MJM1172]|uniref:hypothetical protein n=1 Tax=Streptomyces sp. MJM1172 TaxID=1703926 RepID=UPI000AFF88BC|nr:hypothetical protein [Streptomyces sp. MJM1172]